LSYSYVLTTTVGKIRLLISDHFGESDAFFSDEELTAFFDMEGGIKLASAQALESWATDEVMVTKAIILLDLTTNGPEVAALLLRRAADLRGQAADESVDAGFDIAQPVYGVFGLREQILKAGLNA